MIIVRYSEIGLKGKNRILFEKKLVENIKAVLESNSINYEKIERPYGRILIFTENPCACLKCVFGIASYSIAVCAGFNMEEAKKTAEQFIGMLSPEKTFRISCQRLDKKFPINSQQFCAEIGAFVAEKTGAKAKMKGADLELCAEIINGFIYFFTERIECFGGLPVGIEGRVIALLEDERSVLAALLMMKRGCSITAASLNDFNISLIKKFSAGTKTELVKIKNISELDTLAKEQNAKAIVINQQLDEIKELGIQTPVLRPLVGYTKEEIEAKLNEFRQAVC